MAGAVVGGWLSGTIPDEALLLVIGVLLLYFGVDLLRPRSTPAARRPDGQLDIRAAVLTGATIGLIGGFVGLILGALRMPALLRYVGETPGPGRGHQPRRGRLRWRRGRDRTRAGGRGLGRTGICSAASIPGALLGARLTGRLSERALLRAIGAVLVAAGATTILQALV